MPFSSPALFPPIFGLTTRPAGIGKLRVSPHCPPVHSCPACSFSLQEVRARVLSSGLCVRRESKKPNCAASIQRPIFGSFGTFFSAVVGCPARPWRVFLNLDRAVDRVQTHNLPGVPPPLFLAALVTRLGHLPCPLPASR